MADSAEPPSPLYESRVYIQLSSVPRLLAASHRGSSSARRALLLPTALLVILGFGLLLNALRGLDYIFASGFRRVPVRGPVFVVATPRSGTTFLHHLLTLDEENFTYQKLYQTVFPTVLINRVARSLAAFERVTRIPLSGVVGAINRRMFRHWNGIHEVNLDTEEEDENLFFSALVSPALYLLMPFINEAPEYQDLSVLPAKRQEKLSRDYVLSVKRHLYTEGKNSVGKPRDLVIKNVLLPSRFGLTRKAFPDAKFVRLVRDPRTAIPSAMSMFFSSWKIHSPRIPMNGPETRALGLMFMKHYRFLHEQSQGQHAASLMTVRFEELVRQPVDTVQSIYAFLGKEFRPEYAHRLEETCSAPKAFKSAHNYSLTDFGLSEEDIISELGDIMEPLGYLKCSPLEPAQESRAN